MKRISMKEAKTVLEGDIYSRYDFMKVKGINVDLKFSETEAILVDPSGVPIQREELS